LRDWHARPPDVRFLKKNAAVLSATEVLKQWSETARSSDSELAVTPEAIERFADDTPRKKRRR
jgi:hypothetical protein